MNGERITSKAFLKEATPIAIACGVALVALLAWPDRGNASQPGLFFIAMAVFVISTVICRVLAIGSLPPTHRRRSFRYAWPADLGVFLGVVWIILAFQSGGDSAVRAWAIGAPVMLLGSAYSDVLWNRSMVPAAIA